VVAQAAPEARSTNGARPTRGRVTTQTMDRRRLEEDLAKAQRELDAATKLTEVKEAAKRLNLAREVDAEGAKKPKRTTSRNRDRASS